MYSRESNSNQTGQSPPYPKNVIWIFGDQHRRGMLSRMGDPNVSTPNIDHLAEYGITFTRARSNFPLCCPARGTLLTGRHAHRCIPGHNFGIPQGQRTFAQDLSDAGIRTAWFGKWHVEGFKQRDPETGADTHTGRLNHPQTPADSREQRDCHLMIPRERRGGFQTWLGYENNNCPQNTWVHGHDEQGNERDLQRLPGFETDALTDELCNYIGKRAEDGDRFFASLSVQPPHDPYSAPEPFMSKYLPTDMKFPPNVPDVRHIRDTASRELAGACALIENLDWNVGRIRAKLSEHGMDQNTCILFFSDHGDLHGSHGQFHKTAPWEESVGIPFIMGGGWDVQQGGAVRRWNDAPVSLVDLPPTTLGLFGVPPPDTMQGKDISTCFTDPSGKNSPENVFPDSVLLQVVEPTGHGNSVDRAWRGVATRDGWKYICFENTDWLMFDLNTDPCEQINLAHNSIYRSQRQRLRRLLNDLLNQNGDRFNVPED